MKIAIYFRDEVVVPYRRMSGAALDNHHFYTTWGKGI